MLLWLQAIQIVSSFKEDLEKLPEQHHQIEKNSLQILITLLHRKLLDAMARLLSLKRQKLSAACYVVWKCFYQPVELEPSALCQCSIELSSLSPDRLRLSVMHIRHKRRNALKYYCFRFVLTLRQLQHALRLTH